MKSVCTFLRREGLSRAQFHEYYENQHAPLGQSHFPFTRYVRNHVENMPDVPFETISEFWAEDLAVFGSLLDGPVGAIMAEDEAKFMQRDRCEAGMVGEIIYSDGPSVDEAGLRDVVLIHYGTDAVTGEEAVRNWAVAVSETQTGVSLDLLHPMVGEQSFPADALLWLPDFTKAPPSPSMLHTRSVRVRRCETPLSELLPYKNANVHSDVVT